MKPARADRCAAMLSLLLLGACATSAVDLPPRGPGAPLVPEVQATVEDSPAVAALGRLAEHPILTLAEADAEATMHWVAEHRDALGPLKTFRAMQCPLAVGLAVGDLRSKIVALQERLRAVESRLGHDEPGPQLILALTRLKYGETVDPQEAIGRLRDDIGNRLSAVTLSCAGLLPTKQIREIAGLAAQAGILTTPLGALGGLVR